MTPEEEFVVDLNGYILLKAVLSTAEVAELVPLVVGVGALNTSYLDVKRDRMGHSLPAHLTNGLD